MTAVQINLPSDTTTADGARQPQWVGRGQKTSDGAGVSLTRVIGTAALPDLDPFLMLDEFSSSDPDDYVAGFPEHPHRGFETVTYMLDGNMRHKDSLGNEGLLKPGSLQWMTAGRGILHSEMPEQQDGLMRGFQLWVNLPSKDKLCEPCYQDIEPERLPTFSADGLRGKVLAGSFAGMQSPVHTGRTSPLYLDLSIDTGKEITVPIPSGETAFLYIFEGSAAIGDAGKTLSAGHIVVLTDGEFVRIIAAEQGCRLLAIAGKPLREPIAKHGPIVMNTSEEISQAFVDLRSGQFGR